VPLYLRTPGFAAINLRAAIPLAQRVQLTVAVLNALDRNYRIHGSGVDAPGVNVFAGLSIGY
jgi:hypothetical protein